jgi:hypothetical protein
LSRSGPAKIEPLPSAENFLMYWDVIEVKPEPDFCLFVRFKDGLAGHVRLRREDLTGALAPLLDARFFEQVFIDQGAVAWPGEIDLAPMQCAPKLPFALPSANLRKLAWYPNESDNAIDIRSKPRGETPTRRRPVGRSCGNAGGGAGPRLATAGVGTQEGEPHEESGVRTGMGRRKTPGPSVPWPLSCLCTKRRTGHRGSLRLVREPQSRTWRGILENVLRCRGANSAVCPLRDQAALGLAAA